jgi:hypothetical protein
MPANDAASDARSRQRQHDRRGEQPARPRQDRPSKDLVRPSAVLDAAAVRSGVSPAQTRTTEPSRTTGPARVTVPQFTGVLEIESVPAGAAVFINQQHVGETPVLTRFRAGSHAVRIEREGYERWTAAVFVPADKQTRVSAELHSSPGR